MIALIKKELREALAGLAILLGLAYFAVEAVLRDGQALVHPTLDARNDATRTALLAVCLLAFWQFGGERLRGTWSYLALRGVSRTQLFAAKLGVGAVGLMLVFAATLAFHTYAFLLGADGRLLVPARIADAAVLFAMALPVYAISAHQFAGWRGGLASGLRRGGLALVASAGFLMWIPRLTGGLLGTPRLWLELVLALLATAGFAALAHARFTGNADEDVPEPRLRLRVSTVLLAVLCVGQLWPLAHWLRAKTLAGVPGPDGMLVWHEDGSFARLERAGTQLVLRAPDGETLGKLADAPGVQEDKAVDGWRRVLEAPPRWYAADDPRPLDIDRLEPARRYTSSRERALHASDALVEGESAVFFAFAVLETPSGVVRVRYVPKPDDQEQQASAVPVGFAPGERAFQRVLSRPDGRILSRETWVLAAEGDGASLLFDPSDRSLWTVRLESEGHELVPLELPDGRSAASLEARLVSEDERGFGPRTSVAVLRANDGTAWTFGGGEFHTTDGREDFTDHSTLDSKRRVASQWTLGSFKHGRAETVLFDRDGAFVRSAVNERSATRPERWRDATVVLLSGLEPSALALLGTLQPRTMPEPLDLPLAPDQEVRGFELDPFLAGFQRPLSSLVALLFAGLCAVHVWRSEPRGERHFWTALVALLGLAGWVAWRVARAPQRRLETLEGTEVTVPEPVLSGAAEPAANAGGRAA